MLKLECYECKMKKQENFYCINCKIKTCSTECLIKHRNITHLTSKIKPISTNSNTFNKCLFNLFTTGEYIKNLSDPDPLFEFKNFEIKKQFILGKGAYGDVYYARNRINNHFYAIKQINKEKLILKGGSIDTVINEININRRLIHNNIVRLYTHYEDSESYYLIMDYYPNGNLFQKLKLIQFFDEKTAYSYFIQTCSAIHFLHSNNLVHRDLKPENLLLDSNNNIKLCDFGCCTEIGFGNRVTVCGTLEYMAPEIINELPYNSSIDIWSLGVLLYELLHGHSPFRSRNSNPNNYQEIKENMQECSINLDKTLSPECCDLIKKLLNPNPNERIKLKEVLSHPWVTFFNKIKLSTKENNGVDRLSKDNNTISIDKFKREIIFENKKNISLSNEVIESLMTNNEDIIINRKKSSNFFEKVLKKVNEKNKNKRTESKFNSNNNNSTTLRILNKYSNEVSNKSELSQKEFKEQNHRDLDTFKTTNKFIRKKNKAKTLKIITNINIKKGPLIEPPNSKSKNTVNIKQLFSTNFIESESKTKYLKIDLYNNKKSLNDNLSPKDIDLDLSLQKSMSKESSNLKCGQNALVKIDPQKNNQKNLIQCYLYQSNEVRSKSLDKYEIKKNELLNNALVILEKSEKVDCINVHKVVNEKEANVWSKISNFFNPFKCGSSN